LKAVESYMAGKNPSAPAKWDGKSFPGRDAFQVGKSHPAVTVLGQRLVAHGYSKHYKVGPGPTFSEADKKNVQDFQKAQGWTGSDADGFPGPETWKRLMATAKGEKKPSPKPDPKPDQFIRVQVNGKQQHAFQAKKSAESWFSDMVKPGDTVNITRGK
jgi:peptidoglycan hydrolase-like protein with peptidoglycan-binding domain